MKTAQLESKIDNSCLEGDEKEGWEDSDDGEDEEDGEDQDSDHADHFDNLERGGAGEMEYDAASGELIEVPRKWGKWFNLVRKDDEGDDEFF
jgi:hypothetical protein